MQAAPQSLRALIRGRTQGVGFRAFVRAEAGRLGLTGYTRNLADGQTVEVVAEGPRENLDALVRALHRGPPLARVESVEVTWAGATAGYEGFEVRT